jgi:hypothetical protein
MAASAGASAASAEAPDFGRCLKVAKGTGTYATGNCTTTEGVNKNWNWISGPGPNPHFTVTIKAEEKHPFYFEGMRTKARIVCLQGAGTGEVTGAKTIGPISPFVWEDCEAAGIGGPDDGLLHTEVGGGFVGVWQKGETAANYKLGLEFDPLKWKWSGAGGGVKGQVEGAVIGKLTLNNSMTLTKKLEFASKTKPPLTQVPEKFEGEPAVSMTETINGNPEGMVLVLRATITFAEKMEINSVY